MNKQPQTALNMARFIKSQSLTLLEKLDALDADEQATLCERLHELAEELCDSIQMHFESQYGTIKGLAKVVAACP
ncbi:Rop family plasmid primer RNA-binding protein [Escherichia coli]|nr:Rop family plasmid primer RNA-binding protein [Escherichia coli]